MKEENIVPNIHTFKEITDFLLSQSSKIYKENIFRPIEPKIEDLQALQCDLPKDRFFTQLGFVAQRSDLPSIGSKPCFDGWEVSKSVTTEAAQAAVIQNYHVTISEKWHQYLGADIDKLNNDFLSELVTKDNVIQITKFGKCVGMLFVFSSKDCLGQRLTQIGHIWVERNLEQHNRKTCHTLILEWLKSNSLPLLQAGIHLYNVRSQKFFLKIGFQLVCAHVFDKSKF